MGYAALTEFEHVGVGFLAIAIGVGILVEIFEYWLGMRFAQRFGGSRRAGWGALLGAIVGGIVGLPVAVVGSIAGAFLGAFVGAAAFQWTAARQVDASMRAGWGAVLGKALATAAKVAIAVGLLVAATISALR